MAHLNDLFPGNVHIRPETTPQLNGAGVPRVVTRLPTERVRGDLPPSAGSALFGQRADDIDRSRERGVRKVVAVHGPHPLHQGFHLASGSGFQAAT